MMISLMERCMTSKGLRPSSYHLIQLLERSRITREEPLQRCHEQKGERKEWHKKAKHKNSNQNGGGGLTGDSLDDSELIKEPEPVQKTGKRKKITISSSVKAKVEKSFLCGIFKKAKMKKDKKLDARDGKCCLGPRTTISKESSKGKDQYSRFGC
eukprot:15324256-Ditylum_brightwellii.AAC.1